jgi:hypothetical protein
LQDWLVRQIADSRSFSSRRWLGSAVSLTPFPTRSAAAQKTQRPIHKKGNKRHGLDATAAATHDYNHAHLFDGNAAYLCIKHGAYVAVHQAEQQVNEMEDQVHQDQKHFYQGTNAPAAKESK